MTVTAVASCAGVKGGANAAVGGSCASGGFVAGAALCCADDSCGRLPALLPDAAAAALLAPCAPRRKLVRTICSTPGDDGGAVTVAVALPFFA